MVPDYTINDAWEDGYQVGYERGVLRALEFHIDGQYLATINLDSFAEYLSHRPPVTNTKEEWIDILKKSVERIGYTPLKIKEG
jgi:hypothetical protein